MDDPGSSADVEALVQRIDQARFTVAFRGFEPREVQDFLHLLADEIRALAVNEPAVPATATAPPAPTPPPVAPKTWAKAEAEAAELVRVAEEKAAKILAEAKAEADAMRAEAAETLEKARTALLDSIRGANALIGRARTESDPALGLGGSGGRLQPTAPHEHGAGADGQEADGG